MLTGMLSNQSWILLPISSFLLGAFAARRPEPFPEGAMPEMEGDIPSLDAEAKL